MRKIHPYDLFVLMSDNPEFKVEFLDQYIDIDIGRDYMAQGNLVKINDEIVIQTTTVPYYTDKLI